MTKLMQIPLVKPRLSADDISAAVNVLNSGQLICGPVVKEFEQRLADYLNIADVVCVSSGTAALHLGLLSLGIGHGDEVIVPAFSYPASANAIELTGARPIFIDSEPGGFNVNYKSIENKITTRTKAIMVVHNFGWPMDIDKIKIIAAKHHLPVFEDAACALGSLVDNIPCGRLGEIAAFSFHPRKILTTGEGGAVATNDSAIAAKIRQLRNHGQIYNPGPVFELAGFNYRLTEFQAAIGIRQLERLDSTLKARRSAAEYYTKNLGRIDYIQVPVGQDGIKPNHQTYVVFVKESNRDSLIKYLKDKGIEAGIGTYSIPHTQFYSTKYGYCESDFANSFAAFENLLSLPLFEGITSTEQDRVIDEIRSYKPEKAYAAEHKAAILS